MFSNHKEHWINEQTNVYAKDSNTLIVIVELNKKSTYVYDTLIAWSLGDIDKKKVLLY